MNVEALREIVRPIVQTCAFERLSYVWEEIEREHGNDGVRALCLEDRYFLLTVVCGRVDAKHPWLYARCREVEASPDGHIDLWAREHYKSTLITFAGSIQEILRDPNITIGIFSHTAPIAKKFLGQIKEELERNKRLIGLFPDVLWDKPEAQSPLWSVEKGLKVKRTSNPKEATVEAWGLVDGQPVSAHFSILIYDDVVTLASVSTPEQVEKTTAAWALSDNLGARDGSGRLRKWIVGTRYTFGDTYQWMLDRGVANPRLYPATDDGTVKGAPVYLTQEAWDEKIKHQPSAILAAQMLQNPAAGTSAMFQKEWLRFSDIRPATLNVYILCDPAGSRKKGSDNTAIAVLGLDAGWNKWLLDGFHHKMGLQERWMRIRELRKRWKSEPGVQHVFVGYERYGMQSDIEYFTERMEIERDAFEITELAWPLEGSGSKKDRIQRLEPDHRAGKIFLASQEEKETSRQAKLRERGEEHRIFRPPRKVDENGVAYSLNKHYIDVYLRYPFVQHEDLLDAASRIYDMNPRPPIIVDQRALEPESFIDGI